MKKTGSPKRRPEIAPDSRSSAGRKSRSRESAAAREAARYKKIRHDHSVEIAEDYVELILQLIRTVGEARAVDIAARLGVTHVTVAKTIARLQDEGLVRAAPYRAIFLTDAGQALAYQAEARHNLVVRFLTKLGVNSNDAEADAEGIEHHISDATMAAIRRFVGTD